MSLNTQKLVNIFALSLSLSQFFFLMGYDALANYFNSNIPTFTFLIKTRIFVNSIWPVVFDSGSLFIAKLLAREPG